MRLATGAISNHHRSIELKKEKRLALFSTIALAGLASCVVDSPPDQNRFGFLNEIHLTSPTRFVPFRRSGFSSDLLVGENQFLLYYEPDISPDQKNRIEDWLLGQNARKVGQNPFSSMTQYEVFSSVQLNSILDYLNAQPGVVTAIPNLVLRPTLNPDPDLSTSFDSGNWWLTSLNLRDAWSITTGSRAIPIAIVDSGIDSGVGGFGSKPITHFVRCTRPIGGRTEVYFSLLAGSNPYHCSQYISGVHGTQVASIAAAPGDDHLGGAGVAWQNPLISIDAYGYSGVGSVTLAETDAAIQTAIRAGARVINVSLGYGGCIAPLFCISNNQEARHIFRSGFINSARVANRNNALVVFAAGNDGFSGDDSWLSPADRQYERYFITNVLFVGSVDYLNDPTCNACNFSSALQTICRDNGTSDLSRLNRCNCFWCSSSTLSGRLTASGRVVELYTPGCHIAVPMSSTLVQGSSISSPMVSGAAALVWSVNPNLTAPQVKQILLDTARSASSLGGCMDVGRGIPDVAAAVRAARATLQDASVPTDASVDATSDVSRTTTFYSQARLLRNNDVLLRGNEVLPGTHYSALLTRLSSSGRPLWTFQPSRSESQIGALYEDERGLWISGRWQSGGSTSRAALAQLDSSGALVSERLLPDSDLIRSLFVNPDGSLVGDTGYQLFEYDSSGRPVWVTRARPATPFDVVRTSAGYAFFRYNGLYGVNRTGNIVLDSGYVIGHDNSFAYSPNAGSGWYILSDSPFSDQSLSHLDYEGHSRFLGQLSIPNLRAFDSPNSLAMTRASRSFVLFARYHTTDGAGQTKLFGVSDSATILWSRSLDFRARNVDGLMTTSDGRILLVSTDNTNPSQVRLDYFDESGNPL
ncbi:S8 family serine peptidase [Candidatus Micrarchaeota archaeon]|nr:S8 family serine peptidase [Candidatus Micrarchaeota archaeon]